MVTIFPINGAYTVYKRKKIMATVYSINETYTVYKRKKIITTVYPINETYIVYSRKNKQYGHCIHIFSMASNLVGER